MLGLLALIGEHAFPVGLHAGDKPAPSRSFIETADELPYVGFAIVSNFAIRIIVVHDHAQPRIASRRRVAGTDSSVRNGVGVRQPG